MTYAYARSEESHDHARRIDPTTSMLKRDMSSLSIVGDSRVSRAIRMTIDLTTSNPR